MEELAQDGSCLWFEMRFVKGSIHQLYPAIAGGLIDDERHVPHPQSWMAALLDIAWRTTETADQKVAQPLLSAGKIVGRVHRPENVIRRHLRIEGANEAGKAFFADTHIDLILGQVHNI